MIGMSHDMDFPRGRRTSFLLCLASALCYAGAFPPYGHPVFAWIALIPLLIAVKGSTPRQAFTIGWLTGWITYALLLYWVMIVMGQYGHLPWYATIPLWLGLSAWLALFHGLAAYFIPVASRARVPLALALPAAVVTGDLLRSWLLTGFPWAMLGHSQAPWLPLIQIADLTGVYGITALIVLGNVTLYQVFFDGAPRRRSIVTLALLGLTLGYGAYRLSQPHASGSAMTVSLVQGNIDQSVKWSPEYRETTLDIFTTLSRSTAAQHPALVVWPESAAPFFFQEGSPSSQRIRAISRELGSNLLFGSPALEQRDGRPHYLNSAFLLGPDGQDRGRADKLHLVPFGEYVPLASLMPFVTKLVAGIGDFSPGTAARPLPLTTSSAGVLVCYEAVFPEIARQYCQNGSRVLVNITNDAWFGRSSAPYQHLAMTVFRTIETRTPLIRAANTGISAIIDQHGRVCSQTGLFIPAVLTGVITPGSADSPYLRIGDLFAWSALLVCIGILILQYRQKKGTNDTSSFK